MRHSFFSFEVRLLGSRQFSFLNSLFLFSLDFLLFSNRISLLLFLLLPSVSQYLYFRLPLHQSLLIIHLFHLLVLVFLSLSLFLFPNVALSFSLSLSLALSLLVLLSLALVLSSLHPSLSSLSPSLFLFPSVALSCSLSLLSLSPSVAISLSPSVALSLS